MYYTATVKNADAMIDISNCAEFKGNNFFGTNNPRTETGELGDEYINDFKQALEKNAYVVYSYRTPIAWNVDRKWTIPEKKYSSSTTAHQNIVRRSI